MRLYTKIKNKNSKSSRGFSLIELMVAMLIFAVVMGGMIAVSMAGFQSYQKSKAIKIVTEDIGFAINSIVKDVRMGRIESDCASTPAEDTLMTCLMVRRNSTGQKICYTIGPYELTLHEDGNCSGNNMKKVMVDLTNTGMIFGAGNSGFYNSITDTVSPIKKRGWAEINLNIENENPSMENDSIQVQSTVSSRDYGWEQAP